MKKVLAAATALASTVIISNPVFAYDIGNQWFDSKHPIDKMNIITQFSVHESIHYCMPNQFTKPMLRGLHRYYGYPDEFIEIVKNKFSDTGDFILDAVKEAGGCEGVKAKAIKIFPDL